LVPIKFSLQTPLKKRGVACSKNAALGMKEDSVATPASREGKTRPSPGAGPVATVESLDWFDLFPPVLPGFPPPACQGKQARFLTAIGAYDRFIGVSRDQYSYQEKQ
jgi:hypothetical protein